MALRRCSWPLLALALTGPLSAEDCCIAERQRMVREQIQGRGITNSEVLRIMQTTPRHLFVPAQVRSIAYEDHALPIGYGVTISQPYIVALMTELLGPARGPRVLEIGTGSGYQAAVLAQLTSHVYTIEIVPELAKSARETLRALGYRNVTVREGDGYQGWPGQAPFDRIILTAAPPDIPQELIAELKTGGRLLAPVGLVGTQRLVLIDKGADGRIRRQEKEDVAFVPMKTGAK